ncbi:ABC transporter permease [Halostella litorea]|uniref:ABC transporter permease n=1 Tax=Halostella litorea TaxID=2528831 RepID=UPI001092EC44|nr:ABC transporter permease [Halostella litorea]
MKFGRLCWLELKNVPRLPIVVLAAVVGYVYSQSPLDALVGTSSPPAAVSRLYLFLVMLGAAYMASFFVGSNVVLKAKMNDVYDRLFTFPVAPWKLFLSKVAPTAAISFVTAAVVGGLFYLRMETVSPSYFLLLAGVSLVFAVGLTSASVALLLLLDTPRLATFGTIAILIALFRLPAFVLDLGVDPDSVMAVVFAAVVAISVASVALLTRVDSERILLS